MMLAYIGVFAAAAVATWLLGFPVRTVAVRVGAVVPGLPVSLVATALREAGAPLSMLELKARVLRNDFEALAIVAPPKALGVLKKCLHKEVERRIVCAVNKEMSGRPIPDIEALLVGETQTELPNV